MSAQVRKSEATLYHLRWTAANAEVAEAEHAKDLCVREVADAHRRARPKPPSARRWPPPRCRELREAEARAGAALHRLNVALQDLDREEARAKDRIAELDLRLVQFAADGEREKQARRRRRSGAGASSPPRKKRSASEARESAGRRSGVDAKVAEADGELTAAEKIFSDLTTALADLTAQRHQLENAAREQGERVARIAGEIAEIERELATLESRRQRPARRRGRRRAGRADRGGSRRRRRRGRAHQRARRSRSRARRAGRSRKARAAAGNRGQDAGARCSRSRPAICGRR